MCILHFVKDNDHCIIAKDTLCFLTGEKWARNKNYVQVLSTCGLGFIHVLFIEAV